MRASADLLTHNFKKRFRSSARPCASGLTRQFLPKKTTCSSSLLQPSQKAFAGPSGPQTLAVYPPAALPLLVYECSSFGKSFLLDTRESKKQGAPLPLCESLTYLS